MTVSNTLSEFFAAWDLFREAALAGTVAGGLLGFVGAYIVLRRMVFFSAALSQAAGLGVTLAFWAQIYWDASGAVGHPLLGAVAMTLLATRLVMGSEAARRDAVLGFVYLVGAAGTLVVGTRIAHELHDITGVLFGSAVAVLPEDFNAVLATAAWVLAVHIWWRRGFLLASFDREGAQVRNLPVALLDWVLFGSIAIAISVCTRVLGALPVFAFSVLPAMAAVRCVGNVQRALWLGGLLGAASGFAGYLLAFVYKLPVGASQALAAGVPLLVVEIVGRLYRCGMRLL